EIDVLSDAVEPGRLEDQLGPGVGDNGAKGITPQTVQHRSVETGWVELEVLIDHIRQQVVVLERPYHHGRGDAAMQAVRAHGKESAGWSCQNVDPRAGGQFRVYRI